ncbi:uncharacterized protein LOC106051057 [Biomphalaria glabrata]|uniref:Uncharacterized protein LOC106051057 n=1 Tax=Biomphalaria glabrata TaxID=6526 RepID=A0A9W3BHV2_BIOGL|nr:uncharacterized protein LOC106051057 [Biomphalaria glabrata]XP_055899025.1 uncharacterized protein LOC106051057 [Biomphalaria glabrata]XP_055899026.1 uncharacterized protein LOC106051057 [Biomphalaria glabrata]XP_055899027.1 uncharacterized protein LOC106051057 [Biomphalaria glabrata]
MDWRCPNPTPLFSIERAPGSDRPRDLRRFARSIRNPTLYGLCTRDFQRDQQPSSWPSGTEYQYAYCSNYRDLLPSVTDQSLAERTSATGHEWAPAVRQDHPLFRLYDTTPLPLLDKHYKGATYLPDDPLGVQVPEELTRCRERIDGSYALISFEEHLRNPYTPNYRYKDWITRPLTEITRELDANYALYCHLPRAPTQYWDFYNEVRMGRPPKPGDAHQVYRRCRVIPVPANKEIPNLPGTGEVTHFGKLTNYKLSETPFSSPTVRV